MENVYKFSRNELINLRKHFEAFKLEIDLSDFPKTDADMENILNLNNDELKKLEKLTSIDEQLEPQDEIIQLPSFDPSSTQIRHKSRLTKLDFTSGATKFKTFQEIYEVIERQQSGKEKKGQVFGRSIFSYRFSQQNNKPIQENEEAIQPYSDIVISIRLYRPFRYTKGITTFGPNFSEEFLVLGSQYLTELRDKIKCISNNRKFYDISHNPNTEIPTIIDENPGFFYITDTFYNDKRYPKNLDYSEVIRDWYSKKQEFKDEFKVDVMEKTQFFDLNIRLGFPQVYFHSGNCEHLFTFSSVHLISESDNLRRNEYPILKTYSLENITICNFCGIREYSVIVKNSDTHVHDPAFLCRECFENYHYINGEKVGKFEAYKVNNNDFIYSNNDELVTYVYESECE